MQATTSGPAADFESHADPYRRELLAHCYRMLGSVHDAEDLVQETFLRAWRSYADYDADRGSLRTWLYRIATNACLTALQRRERRPLPSALTGPTQHIGPPAPGGSEVPWLQPLPDAMIAPGPDDPAELAVSRDSVRLALVAALQYLPARQRAVLILRDVLAWPAGDVADLLQTTSAAVNSTLQRARSRLAEVAPAEDDVRPPTEAERRAQLDGYVAAFGNADVAELIRLLRADVECEMPPRLTWYAGRDVVSRFLTTRLGSGAVWQVLPIEANGQPAVAAYLRDANGCFRAHSIQVLTPSAGGIARIVAFLDAGLFATFGLPAVRSAER